MTIYTIMYDPEYGQLEKGLGSVRSVIIDAPDEERALQKFVTLPYSNIRIFLKLLLFDQIMPPVQFRHREIIDDLRRQFLDSGFGHINVADDRIGDYINQNQDNFLVLVQELVYDFSPVWIKITPDIIHSAFPHTKGMRYR